MRSKEEIQDELEGARALVEKLEGELARATVVAWAVVFNTTTGENTVTSVNSEFSSEPQKQITFCNLSFSWSSHFQQVMFCWSDDYGLARAHYLSFKGMEEYDRDGESILFRVESSEEEASRWIERLTHELGL
jgi:hypothetical protein